MRCRNTIPRPITGAVSADCSNLFRQIAALTSGQSASALRIVALCRRSGTHLLCVAAPPIGEAARAERIIALVWGGGTHFLLVAAGTVRAGASCLVALAGRLVAGDGGIAALPCGRATDAGGHVAAAGGRTARGLGVDTCACCCIASPLGAIALVGRPSADFLGVDTLSFNACPCRVVTLAGRAVALDVIAGVGSGVGDSRRGEIVPSVLQQGRQRRERGRAPAAGRDWCPCQEAAK